MKRTIVLAMAALLLLALTLGTSGCCPVAGLLESDGDSPTARRNAGGAAPDLETFLDSDSKTGEFSTHTEWFDGETLDMTGEFWVDGRMFRYDIYEEGKLVRSVMSPDGVTAYFAQHDKQICEPAIASVDYYLRRYTRPEGTGVEDGVDDATGATRIVYSIKKTDDMAGSANPWYSEDITYLVKDDVVIGVVTRGAVPNDDGSIPGLDVNREMWSNVEAGGTIPADTFELPYPVQDAD